MGYFTPPVIFLSFWKIPSASVNVTFDLTPTRVEPEDPVRDENDQASNRPLLRTYRWRILLTYGLV